MQDNLDIDDRFIMKSGDLNIVCQLNPGNNNFTLIVITAMRNIDFRGYYGQYILNVDNQDHYYEKSPRRK